MIRPGLSFALWLAIALLVVLNNAIGDTWIAGALSVRAVEWYKTLVPLPYVAMMAIIHARRTAGPRWLEAALVASLLWPPSTVLADFAYVRMTFGEEASGFFDRFGFWWGAPYPILVVALFVAPLLAGLALMRLSPLGERLGEGVANDVRDPLTRPLPRNGGEENDR